MCNIYMFLWYYRLYSNLPKNHSLLIFYIFRNLVEDHQTFACYFRYQIQILAKNLDEPLHQTLETIFDKSIKCVLYINDTLRIAITYNKVLISYLWYFLSMLSVNVYYTITRHIQYVAVEHNVKNDLKIYFYIVYFTDLSIKISGWQLHCILTLKKTFVIKCTTYHSLLNMKL